jgi:hypothetical protein
MKIGQSVRWRHGVVVPPRQPMSKGGGKGGNPGLVFERSMTKPEGSRERRMGLTA